MDAFTASSMYLPGKDVVTHIVTGQREFDRWVSAETKAIIEQQLVVLEQNSPNLTLEQIERLKVRSRDVLRWNAVEEYTSEYAMRTSNDFTAGLTMAHPQLAGLRDLGQIEGYGQPANLDRANLIQQRLLSGLVLEEDGVGVHREYADSCYDLEIYNMLTNLEKRVALTNQRVVLSNIMDGLDVTSVFSDEF